MPGFQKTSTGSEPINTMRLSTEALCRIMIPSCCVSRCVVGFFLLLIASSNRAAAGVERVEFTRMVAHWADYADPGYLSFIEEAKPEIVQVGFYGAHFWGLANTAFGKGYPAHLPRLGHRECAEWFSRLNADLHRRGVKVIGHMNVKFLVGDPDGPEGSRGFFRFYREQWDAESLGPRPVEDPAELLERDRDGKPISNQSYSIGGMREYWACLNNPAWLEVLKAWTRFAIQQGVDGLIANYFYRHDCHCQHCVTGFRNYLRERFSSAELKERFQISELQSHRFDEIVAWHDPAQTSPLRREMLRFSQLANKRAFDEVFVKFGRSIKPDLIVGQWNHLGDFDQISGDERCLLPGEAWGRDEDYLWYSTGGAANFTDLNAGILGEATLQARYIRGAFDDKPFTLGKYESTRIRVAIAELAANGGAPMGFYTPFTDAMARQEIVRYYGFLRRYDSLFHANLSQAEVLLLFPRASVHGGNVAAVTEFKEIGKRLLDAHVLFDILPDDLAAGRTDRYVRVINPVDTRISAASIVEQLPRSLSRFEAPVTVRVSASRPAAGNEITLHFVNYNREEPAQKRSPGSGIKDEKPIIAPGIRVQFRMPPGMKPSRIEFITPENPEPRALKFEQSAGEARFEVPGFLVYGVARLSTKARLSGGEDEKLAR